MCIWIHNYSVIAHPLVNLTCKGTLFTWQDEHKSTMQALKDAIITSLALISIDYSSNLAVYLSIDCLGTVWGGSLLKTVVIVITAPPALVLLPGTNTRLATCRPSSSSMACSEPFALSTFISLASRISSSKWMGSTFAACSFFFFLNFSLLSSVLVTRYILATYYSVCIECIPYKLVYKMEASKVNRARGAPMPTTTA